MTITSESGNTFTDHEYLEMARESSTKTIEKILGEFDFDKAALILFAMDWRYVGASSSPSADDIRENAKKLLWSVIEMGSRSSTSSGPLEVRAEHYGHPAVITIELSLKPLRSSDVFIDGRVILAQEMTRQLREKTKEEKKKTAAGPMALEFK